MTTKMKKQRLWLPVEDGSRLCLDGYPIEIRRSAEGMAKFINDRQVCPWSHDHTVSNLKATAELRADEIDEFESWVAPKATQSPGEAS